LSVSEALLTVLPPSSSKRWQTAIASAATLGLLFQLEMASDGIGTALLVGGWFGGFAASTYLFVDGLIARKRGAPSSHLWGALVLAILLGPAISYTEHAALWVAASIKLRPHETKYLEAVARADAGLDRSEMYSWDDGPPRRYAFLWGGITGWYGVAHDRSETLDDPDVEVFSPRRRNAWTIHLRGPWYYAAFE